MGVLRGNKLAVANIGDSRVILGEKTTGGTKAIEVSLDHKPDRPDEQKRIESCGGRVFAVEYDDGVDGPPRVWLGHMDIPGLAMSRSLGDSVAHTAGVISEPELTEAEVGPNVKVSPAPVKHAQRVAATAPPAPSALPAAHADPHHGLRRPVGVHQQPGSSGHD